MTTRRRGYRDGGVRKRPDGRREGTVDVGTYGKSRRRKYVYGRTRTEVVERLRSVQRTVGEGLPVIDERTTLATFLQTWLEEVVKTSHARLSSSHASDPLNGLTGDIGDELEVLVVMQDGELCQFGSGGDEQVWDGRRPVLAAFGERDLDFHGAVFDRRGEVLDRHAGEWWVPMTGPQVVNRAG